MSLRPLVSIILPTFNRARFLPDALESIAAQTFADWELIVVDDGSTDESAAVLASLASAAARPVTVIRQENAGPAAARNRGIDEARGEYVAFFDSDDLWLPHHLQACVDVMQSDPSIDWTFGSAYIEDMDTGDRTDEPPFYTNGKPQPFLSLSTRAVESGFALVGRNLAEFALRSDFPSGLQCTVFRRRVFDSGLRLPPFRIGEDFAFHVLALKVGGRPAYRKDIHAIYRRHAGNSSNATTTVAASRQAGVLEEMIACQQFLYGHGDWTTAERRALRRRIAETCFWKLGYSTYLQSGQNRRAMECFRRALGWWPWSPGLWKTYVASAILTRCGHDRPLMEQPMLTPPTIPADAVAKEQWKRA